MKEFKSKYRRKSWQCPECKTKHDRDINAAINIRDLALHKQNVIGLGRPKSKACGPRSDGAAKAASHHGMKQEA